MHVSNRATLQKFKCVSYISKIEEYKYQLRLTYLEYKITSDHYV